MRLPRTRVELLRGVAYARARLAAAPSDAWFALRASELRRDLLEHAMPFWLSCMDREHGGFCLSETLDEGLMPVTEKHVVSQARLTWVFARMARFAPDRPEYLEAAAHGFRFLQERL
jgi:mannobiose 2-epimerase